MQSGDGEVGKLGRVENPRDPSTWPWVSPGAFGAPQARDSAPVVASPASAAPAVAVARLLVAPAPDEPTRIAEAPSLLREPDDRRISCVWVEVDPNGVGGGEGNLAAAARGLRAIGYRIVTGRLGFLAVGRVESPDKENEFIWNLTNAPPKGWRELGAVPCTFSLAAFRGRDLPAGDCREGFILSFDVSNEAGTPFEVGLKFSVVAPVDLRLSANEPVSALIEKLPLLPYSAVELRRMLIDAGDDFEILVSMLEMRRAVDGTSENAVELVPQLVAGLLPAVGVVVLVGEPGAGKSTLAHQIAAAVTGRAAEVFGYRVVAEAGRGQPVAAFLAAEETAGEIGRRANGFRVGGLEQGHIVPIERQGRSMVEALAAIEPMPNLRIVLVDPASAWIGDGDENDAGGVSRFMAPLIDFVQRKRCLVILSHHLSKQGKRDPRMRLPGLQRVRGSGAWTERARVVLGVMENSDGSRTFGVIKSNLGPLIEKHEIRLGSDPVSRLSHRLDGTSHTRARAAPEAPAQAGALVAGGGGDAEVVAGAVAALRAAGQVVSRTGSNGLFKLAPPALARWSRERVGAGLAAAVTAGLVVDHGRRGGLAAP